jgi:hypothetical protein
VLITSLYICLIREGEDAIWHLLRVAAGLDSLIVGEGQILAQVKRCYERGIAEDGRGGKVVARMLNTAVTAGKRVRSETGISKGAVSISSAAAEFTQMTLNRDCGISGGIKVGLAPSRCSSAMSPSSSTFLSCSLSLQDANVVIIGAGKMSRLLLVHLQTQMKWMARSTPSWSRSGTSSTCSWATTTAAKSKYASGASTHCITQRIGDRIAAGGRSGSTRTTSRG